MGDVIYGGGNREIDLYISIGEADVVLEVVEADAGGTGRLNEGIIGMFWWNFQKIGNGEENPEKSGG